MLTKWSILIFCVFILFAASASGCTSLLPATIGQRVGPDEADLGKDNLELITHIEGAGLAIAVHGDYAYWGFSHEMVVFDIRDPAAPVRVASLPAPANDIAFEGDYAYLVGRGGLRIVDIQQPSAPKQIGFLAFDRTPSAVSVQNGYAYVVAYSKLYAISVAEPTQPEWIGAVRLAPRLTGVAAVGNRLFVVSDEGLHFVDISNPAQPIQLQVLPNTQLSYGPVVVDNTLYYGGDGVLYAADILPAGELLSPHATQIPGWSDDIAVMNDVVYLANGFAGLGVWDVHDWQAPQLLGAYPTSGLAAALVYADGMLFLADCDEGLHIYDARKPPDLQIESIVPAAGATHVLGMVGNSLYLGAGFNSHVHLVDPDAADGLVAITTADGYLEANAVAASGDYLYVVTDDGMQVMDLAQPPTARQLATYPRRNLERIKVFKGYVYVSDHSGNIWVLAYTPPVTLREVASYPSFGYVSKMAVAGSTAYLFDADVGLRILQIEPTGELTQLGVFATSGVINSIAATTDYAYLAAGEAGILIIDVTHPAAPILAGRYVTPGEAQDVALQGNNLLVAAGTAGLVVLDLQDPVQPLPAAHYATLDCAHQVFSAEGRIYVADRFGGLFVLRYTDQK
ncbi:MAG: hypothetical protein R3A44_24255 [Caldilineaceae bacterium]